MSERTTNFAHGVVARVLDIEKSQVAACCASYEGSGTVPAGTGFDPAALLALVQATIKTVMELLANCPAARRSGFASTVKRPGMFQRARVTRATARACNDCCVNDSNIRGYAADIAQEIIASAAELSDEEITAIVSEVSED